MKQINGVAICNEIYPVLSSYGYYPALTGGLLYKPDERKDCDIVIFRNRQMNSKFEMKEIGNILIEAGFTDLRYFGFVTKAKFGEYDVDLFNPESDVAEENYGELI